MIKIKQWWNSVPTSQKRLLIGLLFFGVGLIGYLFLPPVYNKGTAFGSKAGQLKKPLAHLSESKSVAVPTSSSTRSTPSGKSSRTGVSMLPESITTWSAPPAVSAAALAGLRVVASTVRPARLASCVASMPTDEVPPRTRVVCGQRTTMTARQLFALHFPSFYRRRFNDPGHNGLCGGR